MMIIEKNNDKQLTEHDDDKRNKERYDYMGLHIV